MAIKHFRREVRAFAPNVAVPQHPPYVLCTPLYTIILIMGTPQRGTFNPGEPQYHPGPSLN